MTKKQAVVMVVLAAGIPLGAADLPKLPFKVDTGYEYLFSSRGQRIGSQSFKVSVSKRAGRPVYVLEEKLDLADAEKDVSQKASSRLILDKDMRPLEYTATVERRAPALPLHSGRFEMSYQFIPGKVLVKMTRDDKPYHTFDVHVEPKFYCVASNRISQFALLVSKIFPDAKEKVKIRVFHLDSARVLDFELEKGKLERATIGTRIYQAHRCRFWLDGVEIGLFFVTPEGLLVQDIEKEGTLVIQWAGAKEHQTPESS